MARHGPAAEHYGHPNDPPMPDVDVDRLIPIVTGVQLNAELGDRPLAYRIESAAREILARLVDRPAPDEPPRFSPVVVSDVYYLNHDALQTRPTISVGGPGMNALSASLVNELPTVVAIENVLVVQMDLEWTDVRCAVWGMDHLDTVRAVELFLTKGYLETFLKGVTGKEC
jgi:hypothetical protein